MVVFASKTCGEVCRHDLYDPKTVALPASWFDAAEHASTNIPVGENATASCWKESFGMFRLCPADFWLFGDPVKMFTAVRNTVGGLKRLAGYAAQEARCAAAAAAAGKHHFSTTTRSRYSGFESPDEEKMVRDAVRSLCSEYPGKLADALLHHRCNLGLLHDILLPPDRSGDRTQQ